MAVTSSVFIAVYNYLIELFSILSSLPSLNREQRNHVLRIGVLWGKKTKMLGSYQTQKFNFLDPKIEQKDCLWSQGELKTSYLTQNKFEVFLIWDRHFSKLYKFDDENI